MDIFLKALLFHLVAFLLPVFVLLPILDLYNGVPQSRGIQSITLNGAQPVTWLNQPAAVTELPGSRIAFDLAGGLQVRFNLNIMVAGAPGARLGAQCSNDGGATWRFFDNGTQPNVLIDTVGQIQSAWVNIVPECQTDGELIRIGGIGGNATADPQFGIVLLEFR